MSKKVCVVLLSLHRICFFCFFAMQCTATAAALLQRHLFLLQGKRTNEKLVSHSNGTECSLIHTQTAACKSWVEQNVSTLFNHCCSWRTWLTEFFFWEFTFFPFVLCGPSWLTGMVLNVGRACDPRVWITQVSFRNKLLSDFIIRCQYYEWGITEEDLVEARLCFGPRCLSVVLFKIFEKYTWVL